jgi:hypothetical protein
MNEPLSFSFTPTRADYIISLRAFYLRQRTSWLVMLLFGAGIICGLLIPLFTDSFPFNLATFAALAFGFYLFFSLLILPTMSGNRVDKNERLRAETFWDVNSTGVTIKTEFAETTFDWPTIGKVLVTRDYYLLVYATHKNIFQILPKRAFTSEEQEAEFQIYLEAKVGAPVHIRQINLPLLSSTAVIILVLLLVCLSTVMMIIYNFQQTMIR